MHMFCGGYANGYVSERRWAALWLHISVRAAAKFALAQPFRFVGATQAGGSATPRMVVHYTENLTARRGAVARYYGKQ